MDDDDEIEHINLEDEDRQPPPVHQSNVVHAVDNEEEHHKFKRILIGITLTAAMLTFVRGIELQRFIADFMAVFFITFAALKFSDIEAFVSVYRNYDFVAKIIRPWAYILPFIQAFMGFWYLLSNGPTRLNIAAIIITGSAAVPAITAYRHHFKTQYAYHKTLLRLPFTRISALENTTLFLLAIASLAVNSIL